VIEIIVVIKTVVACVIRGGNVNQFYFSSKVRLLNKKVITSAKKYTQNGVSDEVNFNRDENGLIKDNLIIKGNNLLALHTLKSNFAGKVKLIWIGKLSVINF
jgi:hypothetical protein